MTSLELREQELAHYRTTVQGEEELPKAELVPRLKVQKSAKFPARFRV